LMSKEKFAAQFNVNIVTQTSVTAIHPEQHTIDTSEGEFQYEKLVLALGAKPNQLIGLSNSLQVNNLEDYARFRDAIAAKKHIAIVGAGLVGCEFANDLLNAGYQVTIIAPETFPLAKLVPEAVGKGLKEVFAEKGVAWRLGETVEAIQLDSSDIEISTTRIGHTRNDKLSFHADIVLSAVGLSANTVLAKAANIHTHKGIIVNDYLATSQPDVYALGDCAEINGQVLLYVAPLSLGARALAKTLCGEPTSVVYPPMPIYIKTPAYPIVTLPPAPNALGKWQIETNQSSIKALFYNSENKLCGFTLTADFARETVDLIKKI
jgi:rubredoxin---NAD+ reductase